MMRKINLLHLFLLILIFATIHFNYKRYKSFQLQAVIGYDILQADFTKRDFYFIYQIDDYYPSLNIYTMPLKALKGKYLLVKDSTEQGVKYLKESMKDNPYLMFSESELAQYYYSISDFENYQYYTYRMIKNLPNNPIHFVNYARLMKFKGEMDSIFFHFNKIKNIVGDRDEQIWKIVMSSIVLDSTLIEKYNGKEIAKEAVQIYPDYPDVVILSDYILYSKDNVDLAKEKHDKAIELFDQGKTPIALNYFKDAIELHPNKLQYYNNFIKANFQENNFKNIADVFVTMSDNFNNIPPQTLYFLGASLYQENQTDIGCNILMTLSSQRIFALDKAIFPRCF